MSRGRLQPGEDEVKRSYSSPRREEQARQTRFAILESAMTLFAEQGYHDTTVRQIAEHASVAEQTIYNAFGDKIGILHAAGVAMTESGVEQVESGLLEALRTEPDPHERIRLVARDSRATWESGVMDLERLLLDPALNDPRLDELAAMGLAYRRESARAVCAILFPDELRRPDFDIDTIADLATALDTGAVVAALLRLGWDTQQWEDFVVRWLTTFLDPGIGNE